LAHLQLLQLFVDIFYSSGHDETHSGSFSRLQYRSNCEGRTMAIAVSCRCGKQLNLHDKLAGKRIRCPACGSEMEVPILATFAPGAPPRRAEAVRSVPPPVPSRFARPSQVPAEEPAASPVHRHVWLWLGIAAVVPVAILTVAFVLYLQLSKTPDAVVADKGNDQQAVAQPAAQPIVQPVAPPVVPPAAQPVAPPAAEPVTPPEEQPIAPPAKVKVNTSVLPPRRCPRTTRRSD
jgi:hypothetical protein